MNCCVVGLQWGDEGKGKVVDILADKADIVVRYGGGANAGHTVIIGDTKFALHLMPSGAIRPDCQCVIANGVVVDPDVLLDEIANLQQKGLTVSGRLFISRNAHIVTEYHRLEDRLAEQALGEQKLGTTARGIGPCYADKAGRSYALRMADLLNTDLLGDKLRSVLKYKNKLLAAMYGAEPLAFEPMFEKCLLWSDKLSPCIADTTEILHKALHQGKNILFEGAQGSLLDLDHGTFPFVTSSNSSALGLGPGCGFPPQKLDRILGVVKAYTTRVGAGPFPTEQDNEIGQRIRDRGKEYGTTTGRPRRCGWFDTVAAAYSVRLAGVGEIAMMHLDTLAGIEELKICTTYQIKGKQTSFFPADSDLLFQADCIYKSVPGWHEDLSKMTHFDQLPKTCRDYVALVEDLVGCPVTMLGTGPARNQIIYRTPGLRQ